jgi:electron transfer flavoprotein beta subunit
VLGGPARVQQVIREGLARGADRGIHVDDARWARPTASWWRGARARHARRSVRPRAHGLQSDDQGHAQTGVALAELLGIPHSTIIMDVEVSEGACA